MSLTRENPSALRFSHKEVEAGEIRLPRTDRFHSQIEVLAEEIEKETNAAEA